MRCSAAAGNRAAASWETGPVDVRNLTHDLFRNGRLLMPAIVYAVPLSLSISLVYCATRYELPQKIVRSAMAMFARILAGMAAIYGLLTILSW